MGGTQCGCVGNCAERHAHDFDRWLPHRAPAHEVYPHETHTARHCAGFPTTEKPCEHHDHTDPTSDPATITAENVAALAASDAELRRCYPSLRAVGS